jgi:hypothetical protein
MEMLYVSYLPLGPGLHFYENYYRALLITFPYVSLWMRVVYLTVLQRMLVSCLTKIYDKLAEN